MLNTHLFMVETKIRNQSQSLSHTEFKVEMPSVLLEIFCSITLLLFILKKKLLFLECISQKW